MPATNEYIEQIKNTLKDKKNADVYILNDKLTLSVFSVLEQSLKNVRRIYLIIRGNQQLPKEEIAIEKGQTVCIELLEEVPYNKGNCTETDYNRDMQRLASAECKHIDFYQNKGECLWQLPEGKHLSFDEWRKK